MLKIDPHVVMDLSIFEIGGWNMLQSSDLRLFEEFMKENELRLLLIGILSKDLFVRIRCMEQHFVTTELNVKELMSLREGHHEMMQCYMRQCCAHSNDLHEHTGRHLSWTESTRMKLITCRPNVQRLDQNRVNTCGRQQVFLINHWRINIALESFFE